MRKITTAFLLITAIFLPLFLGAATIAVPGGTVDYTGATSATTLPNGEVVLVFADTENPGTITLSNTARTRILAVGGGGAGGSVAVGTTEGAAGGGGAGGVSEHVRVLTNGTYTITVGKGGQRVQSTSRSWTGDDGKPTMIKIGNENISAAVGGGGGGSIKLNGRGTKGGCGGGGSWYHGVPLPGGAGTEGQGWAGGSPTNEVTQCGGGGGGAAVSGSDGCGGVDGAAGAGHVSDITGADVTYAQGGRGGNRTDLNYLPSDGTGYGFGGDGAVNEYGGAGADGVLIVRIVKVFEYKYIDLPEFLRGIVWTNNTTATSFDFDAMPAEWKAGIESIEGTNSVQCYYSDNNTVTNGLGRHSFTLTLKEDYLWNVGEYGSDSPFTAYWRVLEPGTIGQADVKIAKNVDWSEGGKARIAIDVDLIPEIKEVELNVLVLGSLCYAHGLSETVVRRTLDTLAKVANVDYYYYNKVQTASSSAVDRATGFQGHIVKGNTFTGQVPTDTNNHGTLYAFYEQIWRAMQSGTKYDYIVFSFDRTKVATTFPGAHQHESEVVQYLKPFYDSNSVIWLVDNQPATGPNANISQFPWYPSQLVYISYSSGGTSQWTSLYGYRQAAGLNGESDYVNWKALMGMFDPNTYANTTKMSQSNYNNNRIDNNAGITKAKDDATKGKAIANQVIYDNAQNVENMIRDVVVAKSFTGVVNDNVCVEMGLDVQDANATWTTNVDTMGWVAVKKPEELRVTDEGVVISISNLTSEAWIKLLIDVEDTGTFLNSEEGAKYNERTGKWEKDPNNGPVFVKLYPDGGDALLAEAEAATSIPWAYTAHKVSAELVHGEGTWAINGFVEKDSVSVGAGYSPEVVFTGNTGWILDYLEVDGQVIEDFDPSTFHWVFANISADHDIKFGFEKANFKLLRAVQRYPWNNLVDIDYYINAEGQTDSVMVGRLLFYVEYEGENGGTVRKQLMTFRDNNTMFHNWYSADPAHHYQEYWRQGPDEAHWPFAQDQTIKLGGANHARFNRTGYHRVTWDSNADGVSIFQKKKVSYFMLVCGGEEE